MTSSYFDQLLRRVALAFRHDRIGSEQSHSNSAPHQKRARSSRST